jgi:serine/threonine protein kinase
MCDQFLANEIHAYTIFAGLVRIPKLLEMGDNYIITSYIEGGAPLERRVTVPMLIQCLKVLRQLYDAGYSLLDFKPGNFLVDRKKHIYLIDFEFLYKYESKPDFLNCYDLVGVPADFDPSLTPFHRVPRSTKQFDALWYDSTHVKYAELVTLDRVGTRIKSDFRYYLFELKAMRARLGSARKKISLGIYRRLP